MKKILKRILYGFLILLVTSAVLMVIPRTWSALNPQKPPLGYGFIYPLYLAAFIGLEKQVNMDPPVPETVEEIKNVEYKNIEGESLQVDFYKPKNLTKPAPLLVFIHGGAWKHGKRSDYKVYLIPFAEMGYVTATVSYRLLDKWTYPACVEDIADAVNWFYSQSEKYGYDPDRIALIGGSAGGHLSMLGGYGWKNPKDSLTCESTHKIKAVVDIYGPVDFTTEYARNHPLITRFIAKSYSEAPELYVEASPAHYLRQGIPPTLIFQGSCDELVPASQSDTLKARLDRIGVPCVYYKLPGWPHTMDVDQRVNDYCRKKMNDFFNQYLK